MSRSREAYQAVLLDFDGTYADTAPDMIGALNCLLTRDSLPELDFAVARPYVSHGSRALVNLGFPERSDTDKKQLVADFLKAYENNVADRTRAFDGMEDWIEQLEAHSVRWGIVTNKPGYLTASVLAQMPLPHSPHCVISGDSLIKRKPHPMPALHAAALLKVAAKDCVFVGDALSDITSGRTAGMHTVAASYGYILPSDNPHTWNAHRVVDSVESLRHHVNPLLDIR